MLLCLAIVFCGSAFAAPNGKGENALSMVYAYENPRGEDVIYYLDENQNPYNNVNGEKIFIALPLEHLRVTDPTERAKLDESFGIVIGRTVPTSYFDMSKNPAQQASPTYTASVSFANSTTFTSRVLKLHTSHAAMRVKTSNVKTESLFDGKEVNLTWHYYDFINDEWYSEDLGSLDCTGISGQGIQHFPSIYPYSKIQLDKSDPVKSCSLAVWTTILW